MCGILGYTGSRPATPLLLAGLARLEYRGYDSAGICVASSNGNGRADFEIVRAAGKLPALVERVRAERPSGSTGIGHTRWATHGPATVANAQPLLGGGRQVVAVQNGIVENHVELRAELSGHGFYFSSDTDAECIPHLIELYMSEGMDLAGAVRAAARRLRGANAVVAMAADEPGRLVAMRVGHAGGLVIGTGKGEGLVASDLATISPHARDFYYLGAGEVAEITAGGVTLTGLDGSIISRPASRAPDAPAHPRADVLSGTPLPVPPAGRNGSASGAPDGHFMLGEINEQPQAIARTLEGRLPVSGGAVELDELPISDSYLRSVRRVVLIGMGSSLHAAMVGRMWIENLAMVPADVDNSSEFRYRRPVIDERTLVISVCQSGETADTLAAMEEAKARGAAVITLSNCDGCHAARIADGALLIRAGTEVGVAATKTFTCSLAALHLLALHIARARGRTDAGGAAADLARLPRLMADALEHQDRVREIAERYARSENFLYLGRGLGFPLAMEGALKLKEISYIHAEGYPAGEMKHGPISLIEEGVPVVALMPTGELFEKMLSNIHEVSARGGRVLAVTTTDAPGLEGAASDIITLPPAPPGLSPVLMSLPMQLLAYHVGVLRGRDVDRPRNLAKSVTVE